MKSSHPSRENFGSRRTSLAAATAAVAEATIIAILAGPTLVDTQVRAAEVVVVMACV